MSGPLTQQELDSMSCACCKNADHDTDTPLIMNQACHPGEGVSIAYHHGALHALCATCGLHVASFLVATDRKGILD